MPDDTRTDDEQVAEAARLARATPFTDAELAEAAAGAAMVNLNCTPEQAAMLLRLARHASAGDNR